MPNSPITKTPMENIKQNTKRFFKKFAYKMASKILELSVLFGIGYLLGLRLIRY